MTGPPPIAALDLLISGGMVVTDGARFEADVGVLDGRIAGIWTAGGPRSAREVVDATGQLVIPGVIDAHLHTDTGWSHHNAPKADDLTSATQSAAAGGVTSVIAFVWGGADEPMVEYLDRYFALAKEKSVCDFGAHCGVRPDPRQIEQIPDAVARGVTSFKFHYAYRRTSQGRTTDDDHRLMAMRYIERENGMALFHCENGAILDYLEDEFAAAGKTGYEHYLASRPNLAEAEAVHRSIVLSELSGCRTYIVHTSARESVPHIAAAQARGLPVFAETCPQYLTLTNDALRTWGALAKIAPPLRTDADVAAMWDALRMSRIQVVASDHSANRRADKEREFGRAPFGTSIVELMVPLLYSEGVATGRIPVERFVDALCTQPARLFGMYPAKGTLRLGADADIVVFDPNVEWVVTTEQLVNPCGYSLFDGWKLTGRPRQSWLRGQPLLAPGGIVGQPGTGRELARRPGP